MCRPSSGNSPSPAGVLASSFVAGIFEDFLARDEIQFLGPIFTFHLLAAGIGLLSCNSTPSLWARAAGSLQTVFLSLEVLATRWSSAKGSLRALKSIADKQQSVARADRVLPLTLAREHQPFFDSFGPELSWAWSYFVPSTPASEIGDHTGNSPGAGALDGTPNTFTESGPAGALSSMDEYRPLTTILDSSVGFGTGEIVRSVSDDDFFHDEYQCMGDWLFKDLDWNGEIPG